MASIDKNGNLDDKPVHTNHWMIKSTGAGSTAEDLWEAACLYFAWCETNDLHKPEMIKTGADTGKTVYADIPRPFTVTGLCIHCGITIHYLREMAKNRDGGAFYEVAQRILAVIYTQKLEYAIAGIYNAPIVGKELRIGEEEPGGKMPAIIQITSVSNGAPGLATSEQDIEEE